MQSLSRFMQILKFLSMSHNTSLRLVDIATGTGLTKATALRLLDALREYGLVQYNPDTKFYALGRELVFLGLSAGRFFSLDRLIRPVLEELALRTGDGVSCGLRAGNHVVCTDRVFGDFPVKADVFPVGGRRPLGVGASGLAILLGLPEKEAEEICALNAEEILKYPRLSAERLLREAALGRKQGYCFTENHMMEGVCALGVPFRDASGTTMGALTLVSIGVRFTNGRKDQLVPVMLEAARKVEAAISQNGG
ncbi:MAG: IclR family transcriptional regulator [Deltaproteobacteria bacterium]|nr:IclR family transcriptional regulator [Deltaproteobacteria bacterium]